jgi:hypothetical protein
MLIPVAIFLIVFFMIFVLEDMKGKTSMGVGIGLFGIFSIMRYRTDTMPVREMTYVGGSGFEKLRLSLGTELKLSKKSSLNVGYVYQRPYGDDDDNATRHTLNIGYKLKF